MFRYNYISFILLYKFKKYIFKDYLKTCNKVPYTATGSTKFTKKIAYQSNYFNNHGLI